jgi:phosphoribosylglycinamide formyltransferase-1
MIGVAILISGSGSNMVRLVESMTGDHPARPVIGISDRPEAGGLMRARALGVPVAVVARAACPDRATFERDLDAALAQAQPAVIALAGFMRVLSAGFVARWAGRILNIHPSLLPAYPGLDTHARALAAGDAWAGCTVHEVTADLDAGPIRGQGRVPVLPGDSAETLAARVLEMEHRLYPAVLRRFCAGARDRIDLT